MRALVSVLVMLAGLAQLLTQPCECSTSYYPTKAIEVESGMCLTEEERSQEKDEIQSDIKDLLQSEVITPCGLGWSQVVSLNMSNDTAQCPGSWVEYAGTEINGCGRMTSGSGSCESASFPTGREYSQVCGRILGHQYRQTDAFGYRSDPSIDKHYVDGVSVTYGSPRQHVWSFACAFSEDFGDTLTQCPCDSTSTAETPPYVGDDYFCETGFASGVPGDEFGMDLLWDGEGCTTSTCCNFNSPPWFSVTLPSPSSDDIEVRICCDEGSANEDIYVEVVELYVK